MHSGKVGGVLVFCAFNTASNWLKWFKTSLTAHDVEPSRVCYLNILIRIYQTLDFVEKYFSAKKVFKIYFLC